MNPAHQSLQAFLAIAKHRSFRKAAHELSVTPSALSHALRALEEDLGLRLVNRTTRSVGLTEPGERLAAKLTLAFRDIDDALDDLNTYRKAPVGRLRLTAARVTVRLYLLPLLKRFMDANPRIEVEIIESEELLDIVAKGIDAGVRFRETIAADMVTVPLSPLMRSALVASPAYFKKNPPPLTPHALREHNCIQFRFKSGALYTWELEHDGRAVDVETRGTLTLGDQEQMLDAALAGMGIAYLFEDQVTEHIAKKRLVRVLDDWCPPYPGMFVYYPSRRHLPPVLKAFIEFVKADKRQ